MQEANDLRETVIDLVIIAMVGAIILPIVCILDRAHIGD